MNEMYVLVMSAATLGVIHTLLGPDHYLPFIVLSKARNWTRARTLWITFISGVGHVSGSVILGLIGIAMGLSLNKLEVLEANRGSVVGWMLIVFGVLYTAYGLYKYFKRGAHVHFPSFLRPRSIRHRDLHLAERDLEKDQDAGNLTPWILFLIFVFGPCEVLIPMLIYPAAELSGFGIFMVALVFGIATVGTMLLVVLLGYQGFSFVKLKGKEYQIHLFAGLVILLAGVGMQFLGL
ncbi:MAG: sulfite exporter TauE/SafE family protein [Bacteroidales bacterium]|nr:sulfite exporter TauE/SafE family protein [Bacteroidales bacterium]